MYMYQNFVNQIYMPYHGVYIEDLIKNQFWLDNHAICILLLVICTIKLNLYIILNRRIFLFCPGVGKSDVQNVLITAAPHASFSHFKQQNEFVILFNLIFVASSIQLHCFLSSRTYLDVEHWSGILIKKRVK